MTDTLQPTLDPCKMARDFSPPWRSTDTLIYSHYQTVGNGAAPMRYRMFRVTGPGALGVHQDHSVSSKLTAQHALLWKRGAFNLDS